MDWTDQTQAVSSAISAGAACLVLISLKQAASAFKAQNVAADTATMLSIWEKLDQHWCRFRLASDEDKHFEFGQLTGYYEMACGLFRNRVFKTKAPLILYEHLHEILPLMKENEDFRRMFEDLKSMPETFENIEWLCGMPKKAVPRP